LSYARGTQTQSRRGLLREARTSHQLGREWAFGYAIAYTALGDHPSAIESLDRSYRAKEREPYFMQVDPMLDPLRSDARFQALLVQIFGPK